jgi:octanoyl-[GcvH]:protein N-octanoyltransferase
VSHEGTIAFEWTAPDPGAREHIQQRFELISAVLREGLRRLGVDARIGPVPGAYSVSVAGQMKLAGIGQRVLPHVAYVGGLIVVDGSARIRRVLDPVFRALDLEWDAASAGSVCDAIGPITWEAVAQAILDALSESFELSEAVTDAEVMRHALQHAPSGAAAPGLVRPCGRGDPAAARAI